MDNFFERPKLNMKTTKSEWTWNIIGYSGFLGAIIFLLYYWNDPPEEVPIHYNELGEVTRWGSKIVFIFINIIMAGIILLILQPLKRFPELHHYPKRFNEANARQFYLVLLNSIQIQRKH